MQNTILREAVLSAVPKLPVTGSSEHKRHGSSNVMPRRDQNKARDEVVLSSGTSFFRSPGPDCGNSVATFPLLQLEQPTPPVGTLIRRSDLFVFGLPHDSG